MRKIASGLIALTTMLLHTVLSGEAVRDQYVEAELVSEVLAIQPGESFTIALRIKHDKHWHTYWKNPVTGYPISIDLKMPEGFTAGGILWPVPKVLNSLGIVTYGYSGEIFLPIEITPPDDLQPGEPVTLSGKAGWLMCDDVCIPGKAELKLTLPVASGKPEWNGKWRPRIEDARGKLPKEPEDWKVSAFREGEKYALLMENVNGSAITPGELYFFSSDAQVEAMESQTVKKLSDGFLIEMVKAEYYSELDQDPDVLEGVLYASNGWKPDGTVPGLAVSVRLQDGPIPFAESTATPGEAQARGDTSFAVVLGLAFLGGLILNLMPCVFPVLGLKVMGFVNQAGESRAKVTLHGLVFTAGVLVSFWLLAGVLLALRAGGEQLGWGFQLQSPGFVFGITVLLFVFALNLTGLFEVGASATGVGGKLISGGGFAGSFFSGVLATVVATPCAAPFLGTALGAALTLSATESIIVFTAIALGLAVPYLILSLAPGLVNLLPKPGAWMETFKQLMAFPLFATVGYLLWVLAGQVDEYLFLNILFALVLLALACWVYGRWATPVRKTGVRRGAQVAALLLLAGGIAYGFPHQAPTEIEWAEWSPEKVASLQEQERLIYVDFTARWCATCQANKKLVFSSEEVKRAFREKDIVTLKADWTNEDPEITEALAGFNRSAVPLNVIYAPGQTEPIILPEILTPGIVLEALKNIP